jgi:hypothetical protein
VNLARLRANSNRANSNREGAKSAIGQKSAVLVIDLWPSMAEPSLDRPGVVPLVGEGVAAGVAQHVGMGLDLKVGASRGSLDSGEAGCGEG